MTHRICQICFFLMALCLVSSAQNITEKKGSDRSYEKFKNLFDEEMGKFGKDTLSPPNFVVHPVTLPQWFADFTQSPGENFLTIGISDPGLEEELAKKQAIFRAQSVAAFLMNPALQTLSENFTSETATGHNEKMSEKFIHYFRVISSLSFDTSRLQPLYYEYNPFMEAIVIMKINRDGSEGDSIECVANMYQAERKLDQTLQMDTKCEIFSLIKSGQQVKDRFSYTIHGLNDHEDITSKINASTLVFPYRNYRYSTGSVSTKQHDHTTVKLSYGLWKAFITSLLQEIYLMSQTGPVEVSQVGDNYNSQHKNIARESAIRTPSLYIKQINISNNHLSVSLNSITQN